MGKKRLKSLVMLILLLLSLFKNYELAFRPQTNKKVNLGKKMIVLNTCVL